MARIYWPLIKGLGWLNETHVLYIDRPPARWRDPPPHPQVGPISPSNLEPIRSSFHLHLSPTHSMGVQFIRISSQSICGTSPFGWTNSEPHGQVCTLLFVHIIHTWLWGPLNDPSKWSTPTGHPWNRPAPFLHPFEWFVSLDRCVNL